MSSFGRYRRREAELEINIESYNDLIENIIKSTSENREKYIRDLIEELPEVTDYGFILVLTRFIERASKHPNVYDHGLKIMDNILNKNSIDINRNSTFVRFAAFHTITIHNCKKENIYDWGEYHDTYGNEFRGWENEAIYVYDRAIYKYYTGQPGKIEEAKVTLQSLKDGDLAGNPGVLHAYVVCVLRALDRGLVVDEEELEIAEETVQRAIHLYPYSEFFLNWGRLQGKMGNCQEGIETIEEGMDRATTRSELERFRHHINNLKFEQQRRTMDDYLSEMENDLGRIDEQAQNVAQNLRAETLQFLGFFAAVVTYIITTVQIGTSFDDLTKTATLIPLMTGCLVLSFSVLRFIFDEDPLKEKAPIVLVLAVGFGLLFISGVIYSFV